MGTAVATTVSKSDLLKALSSLPMERKGVLPMLSKVLITSREGELEIRATDLETYGIAKVPANGEVFQASELRDQASSAEGAVRLRIRYAQGCRAGGEYGPDTGT